jgi:hypothetical protein
MMAGTLAIGLILGSWLIIAFAFAGLGAGLRRLYVASIPDAGELFLCFWLGFAATLVLLQIWHCFWAIDGRIGSIVLAIGCAGHVITRGSALRATVGFVGQLRPWFGAALLAAAVWVANQATAAPNLYDSGNYHFPVVRWVTSYPMVKGIGNVDGHLGLNNVSLLYQGMLEVGFWRYRSFHLGNGILLLSLLLFGLYKLYDAAISRRFSLQALFAALILTAIVDSIDEVSTPATDLSALLVMLVIAFFLIGASEKFFKRSNQSSPPAAAFRLHAGLLLCASALAIKLSAAVYGLAAALVLLALWLATREIDYRYRIRIAVIGTLIAGCPVLLWAGRSVVLTGYPFFPSLAFGFHVPWRVPDFYAEWYQWWITTFARMPYDPSISGEGFGWIPAWFLVELRKAKIAGILPLTLAIGSVVYLAGSPKGREWLRRLWPAWIPVLVALAAWFVSAPSFRFGEALLWMLAAQCLALAITNLLSGHPERRSLAVTAIALLPLSAIFMHAMFVRQTNHGMLGALAATLWVRPGPDYGMRTVHESPVATVLTEGGVTAYEPRRRPPCSDDDWLDCVMWYGPIPGAQRLKLTLGYLSGPDPRGGFAIAETRAQWLAKHAVEVQEKRNQMNTRQMAFYFQVAPKTIRLALDQAPANAATSATLRK